MLACPPAGWSGPRDSRGGPPPGVAPNGSPGSRGRVATGRALIELRGGSLVLLPGRLRADESAPLESLIRVEEGDLVLNRCQLIAPAGRRPSTRDLVVVPGCGYHCRGRCRVRERPRSLPPSRIVRSCIIAESTLLTAGAAIHAEVGRGLVALYAGAPWPPGPTRSHWFPLVLLGDASIADLVSGPLHTHLRDRASSGSGPGRTAARRARPSLAHLVPVLGVPGNLRSAFVRTRSCLRVDEEALSQGTVFWQGTGDASTSTPSPPWVTQPLRTERETWFCNG